MLSAWDDLLAHQVVAPIRQVATDDPRWYDRYWFNIHDTDRRVVVSCGMGVYPNLNVIDGFAGIVYRGRQTNLRVSRELGPDRSRTTVGPFTVDVLEGLQRLRLRLGENDFGIGFDLLFEATAPPHARLPMMYLVRAGRIRNHTCHFNQGGRVSGWVVVDGERFEVSPETWWAVRDHSWGIRDGVGGPTEDAAEAGSGEAVSDPMRSDQAGEPLDPRAPGRPAPWRPANPFLAVQFADRYLFVLGAGRQGATGEIIPAPGLPEGRRQIPSAELTMRFRPGTIALQDARVRLTDESGSEHRLTVEPWATFYLAGGGYGGYGGFWHGRHRGAYYQEGEVWELSDPALVAQIAGRDDHVCVVRMGEATGYGVLEVGVRGDAPYAPYQP